MNYNKRIVMCGCHCGGVKAISGLITSGYKIDYFVCLTPSQAKEYNISGYYDYRPMANKYNIPCYIPDDYSLKSDKDINFFTENNFDLLVQGGWQRLFPENILKSINIGALGLHGSSNILPKGRGRSPMNWSLIEGKKRFLMHLFFMKHGIDDGDIIAIQDFDITLFDDIETMYFKYSIVYRELLVRELPKILTGMVGVIKQNGNPSYYQKRTRDDSYINWEDMGVQYIYNFVRSQTYPYPGAIALVSDMEIIIWKARPFDSRIRYDSASYGEVVEKFGDKLIINCMDGLLLVDKWERISKSSDL